MIRNKEEIINMLSEKFGEDNSDESLALFEDISDTFDDLKTQASESINWKQKYIDNDKEWRDKYRERFMTGDSEKDEEFFEDEPEPKKYTFESLFEKG